MLQSSTSSCKSCAQPAKTCYVSLIKTGLLSIKCISVQGAVVAVEAPDRQLYGLQYHPEVQHSKRGTLTLKHFLLHIAKLPADWKIERVLEEEMEKIRRLVGVPLCTSGLVCGSCRAERIVPLQGSYQLLFAVLRHISSTAPLAAFTAIQSACHQRNCAAGVHCIAPDCLTPGCHPVPNTCLLAVIPYAQPWHPCSTALLEV